VNHCARVSLYFIQANDRHEAHTVTVPSIVASTTWTSSNTGQRDRRDSARAEYACPRDNSLHCKDVRAAHPCQWRPCEAWLGATSPSKVTQSRGCWVARRRSTATPTASGAGITTALPSREWCSHVELHVAHAIASARGQSASRQRHWMCRAAAASCTICTSAASGAAFGTGAAEAQAAGELGGGKPLSRQSLDVDGSDGAGVVFSAVGT
jgi:hypothetical protein